MSNCRSSLTGSSGASRPKRFLNARAQRLQRVLDLTDPKILKALSIEREVLLVDTGDRNQDYAGTRQLGQFAREAGYEALKIPSVTSQGANVVVFLENRLIGTVPQ